MTFGNLQSNAARPEQIMVLVAAINSDKIVEMFKIEFPDVPVHVLPPVTLNRKM
jgi:hypothetical protein